MALPSQERNEDFIAWQNMSLLISPGAERSRFLHILSSLILQCTAVVVNRRELSN